MESKNARGGGLHACEDTRHHNASVVAAEWRECQDVPCCGTVAETACLQMARTLLARAAPEYLSSMMATAALHAASFPGFMASMCASSASALPASTAPGNPSPCAPALLLASARPAPAAANASPPAVSCPPFTPSCAVAVRGATTAVIAAASASAPSAGPAAPRATHTSSTASCCASHTTVASSPAVLNSARRPHIASSALLPLPQRRSKLA
jgi:hypothetical protein